MVGQPGQGIVASDTVSQMAGTRRLAAVLEQLDDGGRRRTSARSRVVAAALRKDRPFTAQELVRELSRNGIGRATVFRALDLLVSIEVLSRVHGIAHGARCIRYTACAPTHHHHLLCRS